MALIHIAAENEDPRPLLAPVRELGAEKVILLGWSQQEPGDDVHDVLEPLGIDLEHRSVEGGMLLGTLSTVQDIVAEHRDRHQDILVNLGGADRYESCSLLTAAFVTGVRAVDAPEGEIRALPTLNFSYNEVIGPDQHEILQGLDALDGDAQDLNALVAKTPLDAKAVSYHLRGGGDGQGMEDLGLVELRHEPGKGVSIHLTPIGQTLARGMHFAQGSPKGEAPREP